MKEKRLLIDMSVRRDNKISVKEYNKISKYKDLEIKIEKMYHLKTNIVPVIAGTLATIKEGTDKHINKIPGSPSLYEIKKKCYL